MAHPVGAELEALWKQLPPKLQRHLADAGLGIDCMPAWRKLCKDEDDLWALVVEVTTAVPGCNFDEVFGIFALLIEGGSDWVHKRRRLSAAMSECEQTAALRVAKATDAAAPSGEEAAARPPLPLKQVVWLTKRQRQLALAETSHQRAAIETEERNRWARALAAELLAGNFPIVETLAETTDAERALARQSGRDRGRTIRSRVQVWRKFDVWLRFVYSKASAWPYSIAQVVEYLEQLAALPCPRSTPVAVVKGLSYLERAGEVPEHQRPTASSVVIRTLHSIISDLSVWGAAYA